MEQNETMVKHDEQMMSIDEQLLTIAPNTRNLLRRTGFLKPIVQFVIFEQLTKNLAPPKEMKEKALNDVLGSG